MNEWIELVVQEGRHCTCPRQWRATVAIIYKTIRETQGSQVCTCCDGCGEAGACQAHTNYKIKIKIGVVNAVIVLSFVQRLI